MNTTVKKILVFLLLTFAFSLVFYFLIKQGSLSDYVFFLMWCPGTAAIITQLIFHRTLRGLGWHLGKGKYLLWGYMLPVVYGLVVYGLVWLTGLGRLNPFEQVMFIEQELQIGIDSPTVLFLLFLLINATIGVLMSMGSALGEEIGWRGLLVPELARKFSFTATAIISGLIWVAWHAPLILSADYNSPFTPTWYALACFAVLVTGSSFIYAWLRLKSGSIWPAVILHASHNLFIQSVFDTITRNTGPTAYLTGEFGAGLALAVAVLAYLFWRKREALPAASEKLPIWPIDSDGEKGYSKSDQGSLPG